MFVQGVAYGLLFTVTTIGAQQFVGPHDKGVSTSLQMFVRNIGTSVGVTIMGGLLNRAGDDVMGGIAHLFLFGAAMSVVALLSAFGMRDPKEIPKG
jgi:predicted MFS family arabinose efflux permease